MDVGVIVVLFGVFILGWMTSNFIYGCGYCGQCWLALVKGRKHEDGCENRAVRLNNERYGSGYFVGEKK
jgi:hypothetical protein